MSRKFLKQAAGGSFTANAAGAYEVRCLDTRRPKEACSYFFSTSAEAFRSEKQKDDGRLDRLIASAPRRVPPAFYGRQPKSIPKTRLSLLRS